MNHECRCGETDHCPLHAHFPEDEPVRRSLLPPDAPVSARVEAAAAMLLLESPLQLLEALADAGLQLTAIEQAHAQPDLDAMNRGRAAVGMPPLRSATEYNTMHKRECECGGVMVPHEGDTYKCIQCGASMPTPPALRCP